MTRELLPNPLEPLGCHCLCHVVPGIKHCVPCCPPVEIYFRNDLIVTDRRELPCSKCGALASFTPCAYPGLCEALPACQSDEEQALVGRRLYLAGIWPAGARPLVRQDQYLGLDVVGYLLYVDGYGNGPCERTL